MRKNQIGVFILFFLALTVSGCDFVGDVLEFGLWVIVIILIVIALIVFAIIKAFFD